MPRDEDTVLALPYGVLLGQFDGRVQVLADHTRCVSRDAINMPGLAGRDHCAVPALCGPWDPGHTALSAGSGRQSGVPTTLRSLRGLSATGTVLPERGR
jgi:hypothetical protein